DPLVSAGLLPSLSRLLEEGARRDVRSTVPAVTFPAWTTFATAASPAVHGITDFSVRDGYGLRFVNATYRALPALWNLVTEAGGRPRAAGDVPRRRGARRDHVRLRYAARSRRPRQTQPSRRLRARHRGALRHDGGGRPFGVADRGGLARACARSDARDDRDP